MRTIDGAPVAGALGLRRGMSTATIQTALGLFQAVVGTMMLVAPHQFASPTYAALLPHLSIWGMAFLVIGFNLLAVAVLRPPRPIEIVAHLLSGTGMVTLAYSFSQVGGWTGTINFATLGLGAVTAPFVAGHANRWTASRTGDWLAATVGLGALLTGVVILALPGQFSSPIYDVVRPYLAGLGVAFLFSGLMLVIAHCCGFGFPGRAFWAIHLLAGATLLTFFLISSVPLRAWIGMAYYGGFGALIALLPWLEARFRKIDPSSLRARLALTMAVVAMTPLLLTVPLALDRQEEAATGMALSQQQLLATSVAQDVADYVSIHQLAIAGLAAHPGLLDAPPGTQREIIRKQNSVYPEFYVISTLDPSGNQIARSDDRPPLVSLRTPSLVEATRAGRAVTVPQMSPTTEGPVFAIAAPVLASDGQLRGFVASGVDASRVEQRLARVRGKNDFNAFLVDADGRIIAHRDSTLVASIADFSSQPPVAALLSSRELSGALRYNAGSGQSLAGFARVPDLGWGVVVEQPLAAVLAQTRAQRDIAFAVMIIAALAGAGIGFLMAERLIQPLRILVKAVGDVASGARKTRLPVTSVSEVRRLSDAIGQMTAQLASAEAAHERLLLEVEAQAAERGRLLAAEHEARAQAEAAVHARDEFISVAAHELKTPVTSLQGYAQLIIRQFHKDGTVEPERVVKAMDEIWRQCGRLTKLTEQLLNLSRLEAGKPALAREEMDVSALIESVIISTRHSHPRRTLELRIGTSTTVLLDPLRMEQVFTNLIENGIKFSPEAAPVEIDLDRSEDGWVRIAVRDHGIGIPEDKQGQLFERFYQAHPERHYGGMGIGLYISRQIVELHGGSIHLEQPDDGGSRFVVRLPLSAQKGFRWEAKESDA